MLGTSLGHYLILEEIGSGGMGRVYRARDEHLERDVAIKILGAQSLRDESARKRFRKEALALSKLNHPHIATIHDFDRQNGVDFLVMEYVEGSTLSERLGRGPLPEKEVVRLGLEMAEALEEAHGHGIVHRDLKPDNAKITAKGHVKVLDFGLAKLRRELPDIRATTSSTESVSMVGTLPYMAPEQIRGDKVDARTDIHALGAVLYEMATGCRPFPELQPGRLMDAILHVTPEPPARLRAQVSDELQRIVSKCLEKDPANRYQSATELAIDLRRLASPTSTSTSTKRPARRAMRAMRSMAAWAVLVAVALLAANWMASRRERDRRGEARSVAVLPFSDMSADKDQEFFSDGLSEELRDDLSRVPGLRVTGRTSSCQFEGKNEDLRVIGEKLNVSTIVEGSVRIDANRVRITAQLVDARDGFQLWSESYDRALDDILSVQDEIARSVANALELRLLGGEGAARTDDTEAYTAYLKARHLYGLQTKESLEGAVSYLERAIELDPGYARAWAALGAARAFQAGTGYVPADQGFAEARLAVDEAARLDPTLAKAHAVKGWILMAHDWDWTNAEAHFRRASELEPTVGVVEAAQLAMALGRFKLASELADRAVAYDPLSSQAQFTRSLVAFYGGRLDDAVADFETLLELNPRFPNAHALIGQIRLTQDRPLEAREEIEREPDLFWRLPGQALAFHALGREEESRAALARYIDAYQQVGAYQIAQIYAFRGEVDHALEWLEHAYAQKDTGLIFTNVDPLLRGLRSDPRYHAFAGKMKLLS